MPSIDGRAQAHAPSLREIFDRDSRADSRLRVEAQQSIYATGDEDDSLYLIDSGQVKLSMASAGGKDCLLAIYTAGEVFGESCFTGDGKRFESAIAMRPTVVRRASRREFIAAVERASAHDSLLRHVAGRLAERQIAVFDLVTTASERRLAKVLFTFADKLGTVDGAFLRLGQLISHEELSQIVGTTRPRITAFMQRFRTAGLIETSGRSISVHRQRILEFLARD
ncbi:MAG TPA: Crp/Fnr family transcriptional regulator [Thermoanaerobaculia bacterium]|jgi:CRP-like cAMP-binding protein